MTTAVLEKFIKIESKRDVLLNIRACLTYNKRAVLDTSFSYTLFHHLYCLPLKQKNKTVKAIDKAVSKFNIILNNMPA